MSSFRVFYRHAIPGCSKIRIGMRNIVLKYIPAVFRCFAENVFASKLIFSFCVSTVKVIEYKAAHFNYFIFMPHLKGFYCSIE